MKIKTKILFYVCYTCLKINAPLQNGANEWLFGRQKEIILLCTPSFDPQHICPILSTENL